MDVKERKLWDAANVFIKDGDMVRIKLSGYSMFPFLKPDDYVVVEFVKPEDMHVGDIVVFAQHEKYVAHRIITIHEMNIVCKGDAMRKPDIPVLPEQIFGRVIQNIKKNEIISFDTQKEQSKARKIVKFGFLVYLYSRISMKFHFYSRRMNSKCFL